MPDEDKAPHFPPSFVERRRWPRISQAPLGKDDEPRAFLVPLRFETESLPISRQFSAWQEQMSALVNARLPDDIDPDNGFVARQAVWNLEGMLLVQQTVPAFSYERSPDMVRFSPIDHWQITFLHAGRTWTGVGGHVAQNEPGMMEIRSLGQPFSGRALATESVILIIPDDQFSEHGGLPPASNNVVFGGRRVKLLFDHLQSLEANLDRLTQDDLPRTKSRLREMVFDTVTPFVDRRSNDQISNVGLMTRARRFIRGKLTSPDLTPEALSRELAISRTRLYELFEASGGVAKYIRQHRLSAAHAILADPSDPRTIAEVGIAIGYDSAANFSRAFTQQFGYSPSNIRKHMPAAYFRPAGEAQKNPPVTFENLLKTLGLF